MVRTKRLFGLQVLCVILLVLGGWGGETVAIADSSPESIANQPVTGGEIVISTLNNEQTEPAVAYNSVHDEYLVVWQNTWGGNKDIYAQRLNGRGELLSWFAVGPTAPLNPYGNDRVQPAVAYDPTNDRYLVVWAYDVWGNGSDWDIHGVFVDWDGPISGLHESHICAWTTQQSAPQVTYSGTSDEFMVVWQTDHPSVPDYISGRRMKASDGTFPTSGSDFTISHVSDDRVNPKIAFNLWRNEYLVVYDDTEDVLGYRVNAQGTPQGVGEFGIATWPGAETVPSVAYCWLNDHYLVAWQNNQPDIYARFIAGNGTLDGGPLHLDYTGIGEIKPEVACNNGNNQFLAIWQQQYSNTSGPYGIRGQYVNIDKTLGVPIQIMAPTSGVTAEFTTPAVAGGSISSLVVWEHDRATTAYQDIHGRLITPYAIYVPLALR